MSLRMWLDRPERPLEDVDPEVGDLVRAMILRSYEMQEGAWEAGAREEDVLDPAVAERLGEIRVPTLVLVGEHDAPEMRAIADHVAGSIDGAHREIVRHAAHLPSLERPSEVDELLLSFLDGG